MTKSKTITSLMAWHYIYYNHLVILTADTIGTLAMAILVKT